MQHEYSARNPVLTHLGGKPVEISARIHSPPKADSDPAVLQQRLSMGNSQRVFN
jgi:hypothetical protein